MKRSWGVRRESSSVSPVERSVNPTEEVIAREIRELKEREEELARRQREQSQEPDTEPEEEEEVREDTSVKTSSVNTEVKPANNSRYYLVTLLHTIAASVSTFLLTLRGNSHSRQQSPQLTLCGAQCALLAVAQQTVTVVKLTPHCSKFNPSLYGPVILPPRARPGLMQSFLSNGGKVAAFKPPARDTVVTLRKPQVFKVSAALCKKAVNAKVFNARIKPLPGPSPCWKRAIMILLKQYAKREHIKK